MTKRRVRKPILSCNRPATRVSLSYNGNMYQESLPWAIALSCHDFASPCPCDVVIFNCLASWFATGPGLLEVDSAVLVHVYALVNAGLGWRRGTLFAAGVSQPVHALVSSA